MVVTTGHWPPYLLPPISEDNSLLHRHFNNLSVCVLSSSFKGNLIELDNWLSQVQQNNKSRATAVVCKMSKIENGIKHCEIIWQVFNRAAETPPLLRVCVPWVEELCCAVLPCTWGEWRGIQSKQKTKYCLQKLRKSIHSLSPALYSIVRAPFTRWAGVD